MSGTEKGLNEYLLNEQIPRSSTEKWHSGHTLLQMNGSIKKKKKKRLLQLRPRAEQLGLANTSGPLAYTAYQGRQEWKCGV